MKKIIISIASIALATVANAQMSELTTNTGQMQIVGAGLRVGAGSFRQNGDDLSAKIGFSGAVDGVYGFYFKRKSTARPYIGIRSGLSIAYTQNKVSADNISDKYTINSNIDGNNLTFNYTTNIVDLEETNRQLSIEVPIMASAIYKRLFANLGVRIGIPVVSKYKLTFENSSSTIQANIVEEGVFDIPTENTKAFGKLEESSSNDKIDGAASFKMSLAFEGGYVFTIAKNWLSVGAFFNLGLVSNYDGGKGQVVESDPREIPATVKINSLTGSRSDKMNDLSFGVKAAYTWPKIKK